MVGIITGLLLPKFMSIDNYAYYRIFTLYLMFNGFAHLGFNDGILVRYGSFDGKDIPKNKFRAYFSFIIIFQLIIAFILIIIFLFFIKDTNRLVIFLFVIANMILLNVTTNLSITYQITKNFKVFSTNTVIQNLLLMLFITFLVLTNNTNFIVVIMCQTVVNVIILIKYIIETKALIFGDRIRLFKSKDEIINIFKTGFPVLIGNLMGLVIFGIGRVVVERYYSLNDFAYFSFAISLLGLIFTFITAISNLLYPYIARVEKNRAGDYYKQLYFVIIGITSVSLLTFFVLKLIVINFIPTYIPAIKITLILFPLIIFRSIINLISINFYKVLSLNKEYNKNNLIALVIALLLNLVGVFLDFSLVGITIVNLVSFYLWLLYTDLFFQKRLKIKISRYHISTIVVSIVFILCGILNIWIGFLLYTLFLVLFLLVLFKKSDVSLNIAQKIKNKGKGV